MPNTSATIPTISITPDMRINFVQLPAPKITGGPLAILEYAERLRLRGHEVTVTTAPRFCWSGNAPFPWFNFGGRILYDEMEGPVSPVSESFLTNIFRGADFFLRNYRNAQALARHAAEIRQRLHAEKLNDIARTVAKDNGLGGIVELCLSVARTPEATLPLQALYTDLAMCQFLMNAMPDCDVNIATLWSTAIPVYFSGKGKPVIFMQHLEEIFYLLEKESLFSRLMNRLVLSLPLFKVANSSWLQKQVELQCGQTIPWSNNALAIKDFQPRPKKSESDGRLRVVTYSRPEEWKGFGDAVAAMREILGRYGDKVKWDVFGYLSPSLPPNNRFAPYEYHPKLSFAELAKLYAEADVCLCPSWYESFPLPPLESMASGTAVVTTAYGTEDYAFHDVNALVVQPRDIAGMVGALSRLLDDPDLRRRRALAGRLKAEEYTWDRAVDTRERLLEQIHAGSVAYDRFAPCQSGILDCDGTPFEHYPSGLAVPAASKPFRTPEGKVYLLQNGCKRAISGPKVMRELGFSDDDVQDVDELTAFRIPTGTSIDSACDF
jgi:glycosyltransferase involved in cell wall biosynthesis